jgi:hypothetical protein
MYQVYFMLMHYYVGHDWIDEYFYVGQTWVQAWTSEAKDCALK